MFRFEKLDVWRKAVELADRVYAVIRDFPNDERFGLASQMRRAAVSISSNIAEGSSRTSNKNFAHFVEIAYGSLVEFVSQTEVATRQSFLAEPGNLELYARRGTRPNAQRPENLTPAKFIPRQALNPGP